MSRNPTRRSGAEVAKRAKYRKVHLHVDNVAALGYTFDVSAKRVRDALARHSWARDKLRITIEYDGGNFDKHIATADALCGWEFDRQTLAERAPNLRWIHATGTGVTHLMPLDWLPNGAVLTNNSGVHGERANEYAIMAVLMLNNRVPEMVTHQRRGRWHQTFNTAIAGKTLLILGVGHVGAGAAKWAKRFGLHVIGVRRTGKPRRFVDEMYGPGDLAKLLPRADFVLVTAPDTHHSHHLIGRKELDLLKKGAGLIAYSRAGVVDYDALRRKLDRGELIAILDVFEPEPLPSSSPLWKTPNLIITPHCSSDDTEAYIPRTLDLLFRNMARFIDGKPLLNRVSPTLEY